MSTYFIDQQIIILQNNNINTLSLGKHFQQRGRKERRDVPVRVLATLWVLLSESC